MIIWIAIGIGGLVLGIILGIFLPRLHLSPNAKKLTKEDLNKSYDQLVKEDVYHIFDQTFHDELREKAKTDLQVVIDENTVLLKESLSKTAEAIDVQLKTEITDKLSAGFGAYLQAIADAQKAGLDTIRQSVEQSGQQQAAMTAQIQQDVETQKAKILTEFQENMAEIVSHYVLQAVGEQVGIKEQLPVILREMAAQQEAMQRDMRL